MCGTKLASNELDFWRGVGLLSRKGQELRLTVRFADNGRLEQRREGVLRWISLGVRKLPPPIPLSFEHTSSQ